MANSRVQIEVEEWIRNEWMSKEYRQTFHPKGLMLTTGGTFDFDAVSADGTIVANISTSKAVTSSGKAASAKMQKLRSDMLFLTLVDASKRLIVLSEKDMYERCLQEAQNGRVSRGIEFVHVELREDLKQELLEAQKNAADEVTVKEK